LTTKTSFKTLVLKDKYTVKEPPPPLKSGPIKLSVDFKNFEKKYARGGGIRKPKW